MTAVYCAYVSWQFVTGCLPSTIFSHVIWTEMQSRSIHLQKAMQYCLRDQTNMVIGKGFTLLHGIRNTIQYIPMLAAGIANQNLITVFGSSCLLTELAIYKNGLKTIFLWKPTSKKMLNPSRFKKRNYGVNPTHGQTWTSLPAVSTCTVEEQWPHG